MIKQTNTVRTFSVNPTTGTAIARTATSTQSAASDWSSFVGVDGYRKIDFAAISAIGIEQIRMDRPSAATIRRAARYGITVLPIADYEPWPDLNGGLGDKYPPLPQYDATWARRMLARWRSLRTPPPAIEVWNEPWMASFWRPQPNPTAYLQLVEAFAVEAWKIWPKIKILVSADTVGSINSTGTAYWRKYLLDADTTGFLADPRVHPTTHIYVQARTPTAVTRQPCWWDLARYQCAYNDFKAHGNPDPQVWVTEFGWRSDYPTTDGVTEQQQADYTVQALKIFQDSGMVSAAYCFNYQMNVPGPYNWLYANNAPKPVVSAVATLIAGAGQPVRKKR